MEVSALAQNTGSFSSKELHALGCFEVICMQGGRNATKIETKGDKKEVIGGRASKPYFEDFALFFQSFELVARFHEAQDFLVVLKHVKSSETVQKSLKKR